MESEKSVGHNFVYTPSKNSKALKTHKHNYHRGQTASSIETPADSGDLISLEKHTSEESSFPTEEKNYLTQYLKERNNYFDQKDF